MKPKNPVPHTEVGDLCDFLKDGYYAVKPPILASLLKCYGAEDPNSNLTNDFDDDGADG